jgi:glutathione S-transferase
MYRRTRACQGTPGADAQAPAGVPILWHLKVSNYNEKARWALDYKRIGHVRRAAIPGRHRRIAAELTSGRTFPVLLLDGAAIGDSAQIIDTLERRHREPPLYPAEPLARRRALVLEKCFDEHLGPYSRLLFLSHTLDDRGLFLGAFAPDVKRLLRLKANAIFPLVRRRVIAKFAINERSVAAAHEKLRAAGERFRAEVGASGYLVGATFTVADLTLASLLAPIVAPPEFPYPQPQRGHPRLAPLRRALARLGLLEWTLEVYARRRPPSAEIGSWRVGRGAAASDQRAGTTFALPPPREARHTAGACGPSRGP